jgi:hypothetical protein
VTRQHHLDRLLPAVGAMAAGATLVIVGSLMAWVRTGGARRNSYDLFAVIGRLGFAPDGPASAALRWWPLVPLLAVVGVVAAWWGLARVGGSIGIVAAVYAGGVAIAVSAAPTVADVVDLELGAPATAVGGVTLLAGSVACVVIGSRRGSDVEPTHGTH